MSVVSGKEVAKHCASFVKINPNGVDLAPIQVSRLPMEKTIFLHDDQRGYLDPGKAGLVTEKERMLPEASGFYLFERGRMYDLRFPHFRVPETCTGFAFPRSSINRLGIIKLETAVFDSGYEGEPTQVIFTPIDARVHEKEAIVQLIFLRNEEAASSLYDGYYQNEKGSATT
jgi:deoxycytidine triphosphate deaminase